MVGKPSTPKVQYPDTPPPPPARTDAETAGLAETQRARFLNQKGRASTFLSGGNFEEGVTASRFLGGT